MNKLIVSCLLAMTVLIYGCGGSDSGPEPVQDQPGPVILSVSDDGYSSVSLTNLETQLSSISSNSLSDAEEAGLLLMREEEKLAHDVYITLYNLHGLAIFDNISESEQTHTDAVKVLLDRYNLADPVAGMGIGFFATPDMQTLYDTLVEQGTPSLLDALTVGALIEELDIVDIARLEEEIDGNRDIELVYENLQKGSRNHLRSFYKVLLQYGGSYTPVYLSESEFLEIVNSPIERGGANWGGANWGGAN